MEYNLADLFESVVDVVPDREALVYVDHPGTGAEHRLTYAELDAAANRIAHHLLDSGLRAGEHLGLHLYNGVEYLQTVLACLKARLVPVNVNYRYVEEELVYLYNDADLAALVFEGEFTERVAAALPQTTRLRHLIRVGTAPEAAPEPSLAPAPFADAAAAAPPNAVSRRAPPTTCSSSTPAARPGCPRASCGGPRTSSSPGCSAGSPPASR